MAKEGSLMVKLWLIDGKLTMNWMDSWWIIDG